MSTHLRTNFTATSHPARPVWALRHVIRRYIARTPARLADDRGQALPEFALVLPILLVLVFGIVQFGVAINSKNDGTHVANELARYAIINENPGKSESLTPQAWAAKQGDSGFLTKNLEVCVTFPEGAEAGKPVKVETKSTVKWLPLLKVAFTTLTATAYMRLEAQPTAYSSGCSK